MSDLESSPSLLVVGSKHSGKSVLIRLLLGKYSIGESKGFFLHHGQMGAARTKVRMVECPSIKDGENDWSYRNSMEKTIQNLNSPLTAVLLLVKTSNTHHLDNYQFPATELNILREIVGPRLDGMLHLAVTNWNRGAARQQERRSLGITEEGATNLIGDNIRSLLSTDLHIPTYFMDSVFWRTEQLQKNSDTLTTSQSVALLAHSILGEKSAKKRDPSPPTFISPKPRLHSPQGEKRTKKRNPSLPIFTPPKPRLHSPQGEKRAKKRDPSPPIFTPPKPRLHSPPVSTKRRDPSPPSSIPPKPELQSPPRSREGGKRRVPSPPTFIPSKPRLKSPPGSRKENVNPTQPSHSTPKFYHSSPESHHGTPSFQKSTPESLNSVAAHSRALFQDSPAESQLPTFQASSPSAEERSMPNHFPAPLSINLIPPTPVTVDKPTFQPTVKRNINQSNGPSSSSPTAYSATSSSDEEQAQAKPRKKKNRKLNNLSKFNHVVDLSKIDDEDAKNDIFDQFSNDGDYSQEDGFSQSDEYSQEDEFSLEDDILETEDAYNLGDISEQSTALGPEVVSHPKEIYPENDFEQENKLDQEGIPGSDKDDLNNSNTEEDRLKREESPTVNKIKHIIQNIQISSKFCEGLIKDVAIQTVDFKTDNKERYSVPMHHSVDTDVDFDTSDSEINNVTVIPRLHTADDVFTDKEGAGDIYRAVPCHTHTSISDSDKDDNDDCNETIEETNEIEVRDMEIPLVRDSDGENKSFSSESEKDDINESFPESDFSSEDQNQILMKQVENVPINQERDDRDKKENDSIQTAPKYPHGDKDWIEEQTETAHIIPIQKKEYSSSSESEKDHIDKEDGQDNIENSFDSQDVHQIPIQQKTESDDENQTANIIPIQKKEYSSSSESEKDHIDKEDSQDNIEDSFDTQDIHQIPIQQNSESNNENHTSFKIPIHQEIEPVKVEPAHEGTEGSSSDKDQDNDYPDASDELNDDENFKNREKIQIVPIYQKSTAPNSESDEGDEVDSVNIPIIHESNKDVRRITILQNEESTSSGCNTEVETDAEIVHNIVRQNIPAYSDESISTSSEPDLNEKVTQIIPINEEEDENKNLNVRIVPISQEPDVSVDLLDNHSMNISPVIQDEEENKSDPKDDVDNRIIPINILNGNEIKEYEIKDDHCNPIAPIPIKRHSLEKAELLKNKEKQIESNEPVEMEILGNMNEVPSTNNNELPSFNTKVELSDYVESKVRQMIDKEGVILDFSDSKLKGRIVTKTTIIKHITGSDGKTEVVEDEEVEEQNFGSEMDTESDKENDEAILDEDVALYSLGEDVISNTFKRSNISPDEAFEDQNKQHDNIENQANSEDHLNCQNHDPVIMNREATIVILGSLKEINTLKKGLHQRSVKDVTCCDVTSGQGRHKFDQIHSLIQNNDRTIFVWAVRSRDGTIDEGLTSEFQDFMDVFTPTAILSMAVVLWHPGTWEDIQGSLESVNEAFRKIYSKESSLGFPLLQFHDGQEFYNELLGYLNMLPFYPRINYTIQEKEHVQNTQDLSNKQQEIPENQQQTQNHLSDSSGDLEKSDESKTMKKEAMMSTIQDPGRTESRKARGRVEDPVVLVVGPPGHGKSSVANLLLAKNVFQVRGNMSGDKEQQMEVNKGFLQENYGQVTVIDCPELSSASEKLENYLQNSGFITHILLVWDAIEKRYQDFDEVLKRVNAMFGAAVLPHLVVAVTFWDNGNKAKRFRKKSGVFRENVMYTLRKQFGVSEEPLIYFISAGNPVDPSRGPLIKYLSSSGWIPYPTTKMTKLGAPAQEVDEKEVLMNDEEQDLDKITTNSEEGKGNNHDTNEIEKEIYQPPNKKRVGSMFNLNKADKKNNGERQPIGGSQNQGLEKRRKSSSQGNLFRLSSPEGRGGVRNSGGGSMLNISGPKARKQKDSNAIGQPNSKTKSLFDLSSKTSNVGRNRKPEKQGIFSLNRNKGRGRRAERSLDRIRENGDHGGSPYSLSPEKNELEVVNNQKNTAGTVKQTESMNNIADQNAKGGPPEKDINNLNDENSIEVQDTEMIEEDQSPESKKREERRRSRFSLSSLGRSRSRPRQGGSESEQGRPQSRQGRSKSGQRQGRSESGQRELQPRQRRSHSKETGMHARTGSSQSGQRRSQPRERGPQPMEERSHSTERGPQPIDGRSQSREREPQPMEERSQSTEREPQLMEGRSQSRDRGSQLMDGRSQSREREPQPIEERSKSGERGPQPREGRSQSRERGPKPRQGRSQSEERRSLPRQGRSQSGQRRPQQREERSQSRERGIKPGEGRPPSGQRGSQLRQGRSKSGQRGSEPRQGRSLSGQRGSLSILGRSQLDQRGPQTGQARSKLGQKGSQPRPRRRGSQPGKGRPQPDKWEGSPEEGSKVMEPGQERSLSDERDQQSIEGKSKSRKGRTPARDDRSQSREGESTERQSRPQSKERRSESRQARSRSRQGRRPNIQENRPKSEIGTSQQKQRRARSHQRRPQHRQESVPRNYPKSQFDGFHWETPEQKRLSHAGECTIL